MTNVLTARVLHLYEEPSGDFPIPVYSSEINSSPTLSWATRIGSLKMPLSLYQRRFKAERTKPLQAESTLCAHEKQKALSRHEEAPYSGPGLSLLE